MQNRLFDPATYTAQRKPLLEAATLPPECYTDDAFFEREIERIFLRNWQFVGREEQVAQVGQFFCYEGRGGSAIVARTHDNRLRAFANSCRHRGSRLLRGRGSCKRIVCPYHSWSYQLDGELSGVPGMQETLDFDVRDYPLLELSLETWNGFIFIHYGATPASLSSHLGNMPEKFASHRCQDMRFVDSIEFDIKANWKLLAENALEAYHTGSVHRDTLGQQYIPAVSKPRATGPRYWSKTRLAWPLCRAPGIRFRRSKGLTARLARAPFSRCCFHRLSWFLRRIVCGGWILARSR